MVPRDRTILVLYGSETGNAQDMAEELGKMCQRLHFHSDVEELDAVELVRWFSSSRISQLPGYANKFNTVRHATISARDIRRLHHWTGRHAA